MTIRISNGYYDKIVREAHRRWKKNGISDNPSEINQTMDYYIIEVTIEFEKMGIVS